MTIPNEVESVRAVLLDEIETPVQRQHNEASVGKDARELAHDINNVLQIISGSLQLLALDVADTPAAARLCRAFGGVEHGVRLTRALLERCQIDARSDPQEDLVDRWRLIDAIPLLRDAAGGEVTIVSDIVADLWPVSLDYVRLQNALLNLVINARDAMRGKGTVRLIARNAPAGQCAAGDRVVITVEDEGEGIRPDHIEEIFKVFFTTKATGTGLGLAIVREFGRASRAKIAVESCLGVGTAFHLSFPRAGDIELRGSDRSSVGSTDQPVR
jgi:signal transduction histidine kinase